MSVVAEQEEAEAELHRWWRVEPELSTSRSGRYVLEKFIGRWGGQDSGSWVELRDTATGAVVLDMARVKTGSAHWRSDGALIVRIDGTSDARLFIVEPELNSFRAAVGDGGFQPLADLQHAVTNACRALGADGYPKDGHYDPIERDFSPDGCLMAEYFVETQRMSHVTRSPRIVETATGRELLKLPGALYDGSVRWVSETSFRMYVRHYNQGGGVDVYVDTRAGTWSIAGTSLVDLPLRRFTAEFDRLFGRAHQEQDRVAAPVPIRDHPLRDIGRVFLCLAAVVLAFLVIGSAAWFYHEVLPGSKPQLVNVPQPPLLLRDEGGRRLPLGAPAAK